MLKEILQSCGKKNYKIIVKKGTPGDSKTFHTSNIKLKRFFPDVKFTPIKKGLRKYFDWINQVPNKKNLRNFHPFKIFNS